MSVMRLLWMYCIIRSIKSSYSQEDLRQNGTASQSSTYQTYYANLSVTGGPTHDWNTDSCSATDAKQKVAWWMLTFPLETIYITNVVIYYRSDLPGRLAGFYLFVTNDSISTNATSQPSDGHLCYHHNGNNAPNLIQNVTCNQLGKHMIIYNERRDGEHYPSTYSDEALLELCDVQVKGCLKSWWGRDCSNACPTYCVDHHCYPTNGTCIWGCRSDNCLHNYCSNNGLCTVGCKTGLAGSVCDKENVATNAVVLKYGTSNQQVAVVTDGDKRYTSCVTLNRTDPWLEVDTGERRTIKIINIVFKSELSTSGYVIFISNTSGARPKTLKLHTDKMVVLTNPFHVHVHNISSVIGRYFILLNTMGSMDICEVEIISCQSGFYGVFCDKKCPQKCSYPCQQESGTCLFGCKDGYTGSTCDKGDARSTPSGVSSPILGSVIGISIVMSTAVIIIALILIRKKRKQNTREKNEEFHVYCTSDNKKSIEDDNTYDKLG